jgi:hypothetical protein
LRVGEQIRGVAFIAETLFEPLRKARGWLYGGEIPEDEKCTTNPGIVLRAALALGDVPLHANQLDTRKSIVYERDVLITKLATIHGDRLRVR